jgi:hypothetical protein
VPSRARARLDNRRVRGCAKRDVSACFMGANQEAPATETVRHRLIGFKKPPARQSEQEPSALSAVRVAMLQPRRRSIALAAV